MDNVSGLSVTPDHNLLVSCSEARKLKEFTPDGKLMREITLSSDMAHPNHAVQLTTGLFVLCHGCESDSVHRVCIVGADGRAMETHGGYKGAGLGQVDTPQHLALDKDGFVFVIDRENHRVLLLSPTLSYVRDVVYRDQFEPSKIGWFESVFGSDKRNSEPYKLILDC